MGNMKFNYTAYYDSDEERIEAIVADITREYPNLGSLAYEAAKMEGATQYEMFWKITFPMISPMILVNSIYTIIDAFVSETNTVMGYISGVYDGSIQHAVVRSTAMSWIYFIIVLLILGLVSALLSAYVFYQRKD